MRPTGSQRPINCAGQDRDRRYPRSKESVVFVPDAIIENLARAAAEAARGAYSLKGCGQKDAINLAAAGALAGGIQRNLGKEYLISWMSEHKRKNAPSLNEGS